jgi:hypothetical protein
MPLKERAGATTKLEDNNDNIENAKIAKCVLQRRLLN